MYFLLFKGEEYV